MDTSQTNVEPALAAPGSQPAFTVVRRPGKPLTPVRLAAQVDAAGSAGGAAVGFAALYVDGSGAADVAFVAGAAAVFALISHFSRRGRVERLSSPFHEPLASDEREPLPRIAARTLLWLAVVGAVFGWAVATSRDGEGSAVPLAAVLLGLFVNQVYELRAVAKAETQLGGALLYQRIGLLTALREGRLSSPTAYVVDEPDPARWGAHPGSGRWGERQH